MPFTNYIRQQLDNDEGVWSAQHRSKVNAMKDWMKSLSDH